MSLTTQFYTMLAMIGMGSWLGAALDTYGRFLKRPKRAHWVVFINDVFFWILQGLIIFYTLLLVNEGELRFYVFIALLCGFAGYQSLLKKYYLKVLEIFIQFIISTYRFFIRAGELLILRPIKLLINLVITILMGILNLLLAIGKILLTIIKFFFMIIFTPVKWCGQLLWRLVPKKVKKYLVKIMKRYAGVLKKAENMKHILYKLWKKIRKQ
jgi:spore cortex biosynthesis protein YabQ